MEVWRNVLGLQEEKLSEIRAAMTDFHSSSHVLFINLRLNTILLLKICSVLFIFFGLLFLNILIKSLVISIRLLKHIY